jgi:hypothetical protein
VRERERERESERAKKESEKDVQLLIQTNSRGEGLLSTRRAVIGTQVLEASCSLDPKCPVKRQTRGKEMGTQGPSERRVVLRALHSKPFRKSLL